MSDVIDKHTVRRALWRSMKWNNPGYILDRDQMVDGLTDLIAPEVMSAMLGKLGAEEFFDQMDAITAGVRRRCTVLVDRVVASVEEQGLAVPGIEGSIDRALTAALHTVNRGSE